MHEHGYKHQQSSAIIFLCLVDIFVTRILNNVRGLTSHRDLAVVDSVTRKVLAVNTAVQAIAVTDVVAIAVHGTVTSVLVSVASRVEVIISIGLLRTKVGYGVSLALDLGSSRDVGALLSRTDEEDRALPLVTLAGKLLVLGSLGADASGKVDVGEDAILLCHSNVGLLVGSHLLGLLLLLRELLLSRSVVAVVDVGSVLRVVLGLSSGALGLLLDLVAKLVKLVALVLDGLLNSLLQRSSNNLEHDGLQNREEQLVVGLLDLDLNLGKVNVDLLNLEVVLTVLLLSGGDLHLKGEAVAREDDVSNTSVGERGEALLALDVEADVAKVHLDASDLDLHGLVVLVGNLLATPAEVVLAGNLEDVGSKVVTLKDKVLDDGIELRISVLDSRNGNIGNVL